jgi:hypothetical protein
MNGAGSASGIPSIMGAVFDEVIGPDVVGPLGAQADARSVSDPEAALPGLFGGNRQPFAPPGPLDPLVVDDPGGLAAQQLGDLAVAVAPVLAHQLDDVGGELRLIVTAERDPALGGAMLTEHPADSTLGDLKLRAHVVDAGAAARRAQKFPLAASARIILSSVRSETARRSRAFSASRSLSRFTWSDFRPPYSWRHR